MTRAIRKNGDTPSIVNGHKTCSLCRVFLPVESFCKRTLKTGNVSYRPKCKECEKTARKTPEGRKFCADSMRRYRAKNPDKVREIKQRYYATGKGKECKRREDAAFCRSGGRAKAEARRLSLPLTEARRAARLKNHAQRRAGKVADELSAFALGESYKLAKDRKKTTGVKWEVDHIKPVARGGTNHYSNIQVVPKTWNRQKSHRRIEKFFGAY